MLNEFIVSLSCDDHPAYLGVVKYAVMGWRKFFPEAKISFGFVLSGKRIPEEARRIADTVDFFGVRRAVPGILKTWQAHLLRNYFAARFPAESVVMLHDIDSVVLQRSFLAAKLSEYEPDKFFAIGADVMRVLVKEPNLYPMGYVTARGGIWRKINSMDDSTTWDDFIRAQTGLHVFDPRERIDQPLEHGRHRFSSQAWLRARVHLSGVPVKFIDFGLDNWRGVIAPRHALELRRLIRGEYVELHHHLAGRNERFALIEEYLK